MNDFSYDPTVDQALSNDWQIASDSLWDVSIDMGHWGDEAWINGDYDIAREFYQDMYAVDAFAEQAYQESWDAWNGPVNAEGYTMHDASLGYTTTDTSFIEPASSAGTMSMISDHTAESWL